MLKSHLVWLLPNHRLVQTRRSRVKMKFHKLLRDLDLESLQYKQISELSGGRLQRVLVARALMTDSTIYLLDEPFVGIDFNSEQLIMEKLQHLKIRANLFSLCIMICRKLNNILIEFFYLIVQLDFSVLAIKRCATKFKPDISI